MVYQTPKLSILKRGSKYLFLTLILITPLYAVQQDQDRVGQVSASFLQVNPSVRMAGLGGDQAAASGSIGTMFSNPASLSILQIPELLVTHHESLIQTRSNTAAFGWPTKNHAFGFSMQYVNFGSQERTGVDAVGDPIIGLGDFRYSTLALQLGWSRKILNNLSVGTTAKGWQEKRDTSSKGGWGGDVGLQMRSVLPSLDVGLVYKNIGPKVDGFSLPRSLALGGVYDFHGASIFSEYDFSSSRSSDLRLGVEYQLDYIWLRTGYDSGLSDQEKSISQFSFGVGLKISGWRLDYAWSPRELFSDEHKIAFTIGFGMTQEERKREARKLDDAMDQRMKAKSHDHYLAGKEALAKKDLSEAIDQFSKALDWNSENKKAKNELKKAQKGHLAYLAKQHYENGIKLSTEGEWLEASMEWKKTLTLNPDNQAAQKKLKLANKKIFRKTVLTGGYKKGIESYLKGDYDSAIQSWNAVLKKDPAHKEVKGYIEKAKRMKAEQQVFHLLKEKEQQKTQSERLSHQAYTLFKLGQTDEAIKTWERIIAMDPRNKDAKLALAKAKEKESLRSSNQPDRAQRKVRELNSEALAAYRTGQGEKAASLWKKALATDPGNIWIQKNLKRVQSELTSLKEYKNDK